MGKWRLFWMTVVWANVKGIKFPVTVVGDLRMRGSDWVET